MNNDSLIGKVFGWGASANYSDTTVDVWLLGLALILVLSFLWSTVVRDVIREA